MWGYSGKMIGCRGKFSTGGLKFHIASKLNCITFIHVNFTTYRQASFLFLVREIGDRVREMLGKIEIVLDRLIGWSF